MGMEMTVRVFRCADCGHKMRLSGATCGRCHTEKRVYQRLDLYMWMLAVPGTALAFYVIVA